ncbi:MAG TPA: hypothetical protein DEB06_02940 [Phycisphaerales bacterium]|nr:hypothetical protein [Phycisphaerales bacterium]
MCLVAAATGALVLPVGCGHDAAPRPVEHEETPAPSNRVDINPAVRRNLGITFATVESRSVSRTLRVPGRFEPLPSARREYRTPAPGTLELLVEQYQRVDQGDALYRLDSPRWRELQRELADAEAGVSLARAACESIAPLLAAHESHHAALESAANLWGDRVAALELIREAGGARAEELSQARGALAAARAALAETLEKEAELLARRGESAARLGAASSRLSFLFQTAAHLSGVSAGDLAAPPIGAPDTARWRVIDAIEVRAHAPGVVEGLHAVSGAVLESQALVLSTVQPELLRFRARGLQSDLGLLRDGLPSLIVPAQGGSITLQDSMRGPLWIGLTADADERTIDLIVVPSSLAQWARAGVSAHLEITLAGGGTELAIPLSAVVRDGTTPVIFRRDPADPDKAIRLKADLGVSDGRWVVVASGVKEGDEVVLGGNFQLMLATSGSAEKAGHFHSDGTFHEGSH